MYVINLLIKKYFKKTIKLFFNTTRKTERKKLISVDSTYNYYCVTPKMSAISIKLALHRFDYCSQRKTYCFNSDDINIHPSNVNIDFSN